MKWYEEKFVSHRDWILDHLELLGMNSEETVIVMMIDFMNQNQMPITIEDLSEKTGISKDMTNEAISSLCAKNYLQIRAAGGEVRLSLNGLFETDVARSERLFDASLFELFEKEFRRPLTQNEMTKISEWNRTTDRVLIICALRKASASQNLKVAYIDGILRKWKEKGATVEDVKCGKYI